MYFYSEFSFDKKSYRAPNAGSVSDIFFWILKYVTWKNVVVSAMLIFHILYAIRTYAYR